MYEETCEQNEPREKMPGIIVGMDWKDSYVSSPSNPPDELAQNVVVEVIEHGSVGRIIPTFFCKSSE